MNKVLNNLYISMDQNSNIMQKSQTQNVQTQLKSPTTNELMVKRQQEGVNQRPQLTQQPKKKKKVHLSFEDEMDQGESASTKMKKNPVKGKQRNSTREGWRSSSGDNLQQVIKAEYLQKVQKLKQQLIQLDYSYWDGGDVVKKLRKKKKQKVKDLLEVCRLQIISNQKELANLTASDLLFVVKDFIVPPQMALYEIEALQLKTKKNELLLNLRNVKIKKDGKQLTLSVNIDSPVRIIERIRYEKSKNLFPFCNWQTLKIKTH